MLQSVRFRSCRRMRRWIKARARRLAGKCTGFTRNARRCSRVNSRKLESEQPAGAFFGRLDYAVMREDAFQEPGLTAVAGMPDLQSLNVEIGQCELRVPSDGQHRPRTQILQQPHQERSTGLPLGAAVTAVGHRVALRMRME